MFRREAQMTISEISIRTIPQTPYGRKFADEFEKRLRDQGAFKERVESTNSIQITAEYHFHIKEED